MQRLSWLGEQLAHKLLLPPKPSPPAVGPTVPGGPGETPPKSPAETLQGRTYPLSNVTVMDGDTVQANIDLGFGLSLREHIRFYGIAAPEMDAKAGPAAKRRLEELTRSCRTGLTLHIVADEREKYGRVLGKVFCGEMDINEKLIQDGFAERYLP